MNHIHYWKHHGISGEDWQALAFYAKSVFDRAAGNGIRLAAEHDEPHQPPDINAFEIRFNGVGSEGHETFVLTREKPVFRFDSCNTVGKPYDAVVAEILAFAAHCIEGFSAKMRIY